MITVAATGCSAEELAGDETEAASAEESGWALCANQGQTCWFDGTRRVRFGRGSRSTWGTFTASVFCDNGAFGVSYGDGNRCEVSLDPVDAGHVHASSQSDAGSAAPQEHVHDAAVEAAVATDPSQPNDEDHVHDAVDAGSAVTPSQTTDASHAHDAAQDAQVIDQTHMHMTTDAGATSDGSMAMAGPYINNAAIPKGWDGHSELLVRSTSQQPARGDIGAFRVSCLFSHMSYDDPIVFPGQPGKSHLHSFFGNAGVNAHSTAESIKNSGNSTCRGGIANRSGYWVPAVIDKNGTPILPSSAEVYYKTGYNGIAPSQVNIFPEGLRMIAGDAKASSPGQGNSYWSCETYNGHPNAIPDCAQGEAVIMAVVFPQCWNGKDLDSSDHKSHMAYVRNGACPSTHPVAIPEITFNIRYKVAAGQRSSQWRLASDMYDSSKPGGYSSHGDWFEGWVREIAETFVKNCDQRSLDCHSNLLGDGREIYSDYVDRF